MELQFNINKVKNCEFGVGLKQSHRSIFRILSVDKDTKEILRTMVITTMEKMDNINEENNAGSPLQYEPSEKYDGPQYLTLPTECDLVESIRGLHEANNIQHDMSALSDSGLFCYFVRFIDENDRYLTAVRKTSKAKGILKGRYISITNDALRIVKDTVFKLENDFDFLIDSKNIHIFRPNSLVSICELKKVVLAAVPKNIEKIAQDLTYVDFSKIQNYAQTHSRAALGIASIQSQGLAKNIDKEALKRACNEFQVDVTIDGEKIFIENQFMAFLHILERRLYKSDLEVGKVELFRAESRRRIS